MLSTQPLKWQDIIFPILGATWFFFRPGVRSCIFVVQLLNCVWFFATPWTAARQASLSSPVSRSLLRFMSVESVMLSISSSAASFYLPSFSTSGSFPLSYLFTSGGQGIGASASASVIPVNIQGWFLLGLTGLILQSKGLSRVFSNTTVLKASILWLSAFFIVQLSHPYMTIEKTIAWTIWTTLTKWQSS